MRFGKYHVDGRILGGIVVVLLAGLLLLWPWSRPNDEIVRLHVDPAYNAIQRAMLTAKTRPPRNPWGRPGVIAFNPRSVTLKSDGPPFDAYVLDLGDLEGTDEVDSFLEASRRIDAGEKLDETSTVARRLGVTEATFGLAWLPFGIRGNYMLIVHGTAPTEITTTISYGGPPAP